MVGAISAGGRGLEEVSVFPLPKAMRVCRARGPCLKGAGTRIAEGGIADPPGAAASGFHIVDLEFGTIVECGAGMTIYPVVDAVRETVDAAMGVVIQVGVSAVQFHGRPPHIVGIGDVIDLGVHGYHYAAFYDLHASGNNKPFVE